MGWILIHTVLIYPIQWLIGFDKLSVTHYQIPRSIGVQGAFADAGLKSLKLLQSRLITASDIPDFNAVISLVFIIILGGYAVG